MLSYMCLVEALGLWRFCTSENLVDKEAFLQRAGWVKYGRDNNLAVGDSCTFELINENKISFIVSISRVADELYSQSPHG